jgi:hypothetical protein
LRERIEFLQDPIGDDGVDVTRYLGLLDRFDQCPNFYEITVDGFHSQSPLQIRRRAYGWQRIGIAIFNHKALAKKSHGTYVRRGPLHAENVTT